MATSHGPRVIFSEAYQFQSTAPVWGPTSKISILLLLRRFQSTAPVWGPTALSSPRMVRSVISIHGPRVGADVYCIDRGQAAAAISIHGPRVGADQSVFSARG